MAREAHPVEEAGLAVRRSCRWEWRGLRRTRLAGGGRRCRGFTCRQSLCGDGASVYQPWIRSLVLAPLSFDGRRRQFSVASLLEDVVLASPRGATSSVSLYWSSGGRSRLAAAVPVLAFSWVGVLAMLMCGWWFFFLFPGYDPPGL
uniref:Uncharacterized protein n=1 Tax=Oryza rufipogon TaxID=4529 RepID=A0A0E0P4U1_ORYRU